SRGDGARLLRPGRPASGSSRSRSPLGIEDPVDHEVEETLGGSHAAAQHPLLTHPQALGDRAAPRVGIRRTELHPMQAELVEGEVEETAAGARDDPAAFEVAADPVTDVAAPIGPLHQQTYPAP